MDKKILHRLARRRAKHTLVTFKPLTNLSRRILKSELSKLTQRVQMAECDEIDLNRRIKALTDENKDFGRVARELGKDNRALQEQNVKLTTENSGLIKAGVELSMSYRKLEITASALTQERDELKAKLEHSSVSIASLMDQRRTQNNALEAIRNALNYLDRQTQPGTQAQPQQTQSQAQPLSTQG